MKNNMEVNNELLEEMVEEINVRFRDMTYAQLTAKGHIQLVDTSRRYYDDYELEEKLKGILDYIAEEFDVDLAYEGYYRNSIVCSVIEY